MADQSEHLESHAADENSGRTTAGMPRWVKVALIIAVAVALALIISTLAGVRHGPVRHGPPATARLDASGDLASFVEHGGVRP